MPLKSLTIFSFFILSASGLSCGAEPSSENEEKIRAYFKRFPRSDANNDGVLTYSELMTHLKEMRKARSQNKGEDKDDEFKKEFDDYAETYKPTSGPYKGVKKESGKEVLLEIMVPLVATKAELKKPHIKGNLFLANSE